MIDFEKLLAHEIFKTSNKAVFQAELNEFKLDIRSFVQDPAFLKNLKMQGLTFFPMEQPFLNQNNLPKKYSVIGIDASQIYPTRHKSLGQFGLVNLGATIFNYDFEDGGKSDFKTLTEPKVLDLSETFFPLEKDFVYTTTLFDVFRQFCELDFAVRLARQQEYKNTLILTDGIFSLHHLKSLNRRTRDYFLQKLMSLYSEIAVNNYSIFSYISAPSSKDLSQSLKKSFCKAPYFEKISCLGGCGETFCALLVKDRDVDLMAAFLENEIFGWVKLDLLFGDDGNFDVESLCKFIAYFKGSEEIARLESFMTNLDLSMSLFGNILGDQVKKGFGYPLALSEAHELTKISVEEEIFFWESLNAVNLKSQTSAKQKMKSVLFG